MARLKRKKDKSIYDHKTLYKFPMSGDDYDHLSYCLDNDLVFCHVTDENGIILISHGHENGTLSQLWHIENEILPECFTDNIQIICCYPSIIKSNNPTIADKIHIDYDGELVTHYDEYINHVRILKGEL